MPASSTSIARGISGSGSTIDQYIPALAGDFNYPVVTGTVTTPDTFGRVVFNVLGQQAPYADNDVMAGYPIDSTHITLAGYGGSSGLALAQSASTGNYNTNSMAGSTYAFWAGGYPLVAGVFTAKSDGTITGSLDWIDATSSAAPAPLPFTGTYSVEPNGRVTLSNFHGTNFNFSFYMYLDATGNGLLFSNDMTNDSIFGQALKQQTTPFTAASLAGTYNLSTSLIPYTAASGPTLGSAKAIASGNTATLSGYVDDTYFQGSNSGKTDIPVSGAFTASSDGIFEGTITGLDITSNSTSHTFTLYMVDSSQGFAIESDNQQPLIVFLQMQ